VTAPVYSPVLRACAVLAPVTVVIYVSQMLLSPSSPGLRLVQSAASVCALVLGVVAIRNAHRPAAPADPSIDLRETIDLRERAAEPADAAAPVDAGDR
jgi:hypothetical protein